MLYPRHERRAAGRMACLTHGYRGSVQLLIVVLLLAGFGADMARPDDAHAAERATDTTDKSIDVRQTDGDAGGEISGRKADGKGRRWAVVIGIAGYKNEPLRYADKDARLVAEILVAQAGYEARHVYLLTDGREDFEEIPTRENILAALKRVADLTRDDDTLMVFFSGHGKSEDGKGYLVSIDGKLVAIADIRKTLQSAKADRKLLVLDACHSGTTKDAADAGATAKDLAEAVLPSAQTFLTLASCRAEEKSVESPYHGQGLFTWWFAQGLAGQADEQLEGNRDGMVTLLELYPYLLQNVSEWASRYHHRSQTPKLLGEHSGRIVLAHAQADPGIRAVHSCFDTYTKLLRERGDTRSMFEGMDASMVDELRQASQDGRPQAQLLYGRWLQETGEDTQAHEAVRLFKAASEQGLVDAMVALATCYAQGEGVAADAKAALRWLQKAAALKNGAALGNLATLYATGRGVDQDYAMARRLYRQSAAMGYAASLLHLGILYQKGLGGQADAAAARKAYEEAARRGHPGGMTNLGYCLEEGIGGPRDIRGARRWYSQASNLGYPPAMFNLGSMWLDGAGGKKDEATGRDWLNRAADLGETRAVQWRQQQEM